jgi:hypothetical protein
MRQVMQVRAVSGALALGLSGLFPGAAAATEIDVLSLNIWYSEDSAGGRKSIAGLIRDSGAEVVGVQELNANNRGRAIQRALGREWHYAKFNDMGWYSRYPIVASSPRGDGVQLEIAPGQRLWVFNAHLIYYPYGPYQLSGISYLNGPLRDPNDPAALEAVVDDQAPRVAEAEALLQDMQAAGALDAGTATLLLGDFNEPSSLDWTAAARDAGVHAAAVAWPTSQVFLAAGLRDSWRTLHADAAARPGNTWSPYYGPTYRESDYPAGVYEPQDRIDWLLYAGPLQPLRADLLGPHGDTGASVFYGQGIGHGATQYPSDHRGVLVRFRYDGAN